MIRMTERILSISGLRGVIGNGLDPEYLTRFAAALGTMFEGGTVVLSRDGRSTGEMIKHAVVSGLLATGCKVLDAGIATTPTCGVLVQHHGAAGGLQITASHNPIQWNGLKPFSVAGSVFDRVTGERLLSLLESQAFRYVTWDKLGTVETLTDPAGPHIDRSLRLVDVNRIKARKFKVVLDCNHGSGAVATPRLLEQLGCDVTVLGGIADGRFEHVPEPIKENLTGLSDAVRKLGADAGFAQDPDADRLAIVDNTGRYIGEELTLALCADWVLSRTPGPFVVNGSTSRVNADIAAKHGCEFHRSWVGEANVTTMMRAKNAILGGEGNGGVIEPKVGYVRDSFVSMAYVLDGLAHGTRTLAEWADALPSYSIIKDKIECPRDRVEAACAALRKTFKDATATEGDGLRLDWSDRWVQIRASNTEPIIRVISEAPDTVQATQLCQQAVAIVRSL
jgi:phosphomannomutase